MWWVVDIFIPWYCLSCVFGFIPMFCFVFPLNNTSPLSSGLCTSFSFKLFIFIPRIFFPFQSCLLIFMHWKLPPFLHCKVLMKWLRRAICISISPSVISVKTSSYGGAFCSYLLALEGIISAKCALSHPTLELAQLTAQTDSFQWLGGNNTTSERMEASLTTGNTVPSWFTRQVQQIGPIISQLWLHLAALSSHFSNKSTSKSPSGNSINQLGTVTGLHCSRGAVYGPHSKMFIRRLLVSSNVS